MNFQDLNQISAPEEWKQRACDIPTEEGHVRRKPPPKTVLAAVVILCLLCGSACAAGAIYHHYQNGTLVADRDEMMADVADNQNGYSYYSATVSEAIPRSQVIKDWTEMASHWTDESTISSLSVFGADDPWTRLEVDCAEGPVLERHIYDDSHRAKIEATAASPTLLMERQSDLFSWDLTWVEKQYDSVPYGNVFYTIADQDGIPLGGGFRAMYTHGKTSYFTLEYSYFQEHADFDDAYIIASDYDRLEEYTTANGLECLITQKGNQVWVSSTSPHFTLGIYSGDMEFDAVKEIVEHLNIQMTLEPEFCSDK